MIRLALLRHGHTDWNRAGRIQGRTDIPLDDQAKQDLAGFQLPADWRSADLWSSPLQRAAETAQIVAGRAPQIAPDLIEQNWGLWEGKHGKDLIAQPNSGYKHIEDWGWDFCPPEGEPLSALRDRTVAWAKSLESDSLAVCHIGVMRVLVATAMGWDFTGTPPFQIKRNRLYVLNIGASLSLSEPDPIRLIPRHQ